MSINIDSLTADYILAVPITNPEKIFNSKSFETDWRKLRSKWHPDKNYSPNSESVFKHLKELVQIAEERLSNNTWIGPSELRVNYDGSMYVIRYKKAVPFELGMTYIGLNKIIYVVDSDYEKLFDNAVLILTKHIKYPNPKFKDEFERYLPKIVKVMKNTSIGHILVIEKTEDQIILQDLLDHLGGSLDSKHVAWIISSLCNLSCFFEYNQITQLGLSPSTILVSPKYHSVSPLGGWWYSRPIDNKMLAIPSTLAGILPADIFVDKLAKSKYDRQLIKAIGLYSLGDTGMTGSTLLKNSTIPKPFISFLKSQSNSTSVQMYEQWSKILTDSFGTRKFTELDVDINKIYGDS